MYFNVFRKKYFSYVLLVTVLKVFKRKYILQVCAFNHIYIYNIYTLELVVSMNYK